ncbi:MAG: quinone-dependent dihydroorotate dehydrogenase [Candidatus Woesebacteria bacterium]
MITVISKLSGSFYVKVAKPLLFKMSADDVHEGLINLGVFVQKIPLLCWLMRWAWCYDDDILKTEVVGVKFSNPVGMSAGFDKDCKVISMLKMVGFGFVECGSVTRHSYAGNQKPWYTRLPKTKSIVVNAGLKSQGAESVAARLSAYKRRQICGMPINVSVAKTNSFDTVDIAKGVQDYCETLKIIKSTGRADMYTLNISCPNAFGGEPFTTPETLQKLLKSVDKLKLDKPIFVKMPIDKTWPEFEQLLDVASNHNVQGITIGNLRKDRRKAKIKDDFKPDTPGNLSGKPCWQPSNELLAKSYKKYSDRFVFVGVGGIFTAQDAYQKIKLGASLVEMITGVIFNGPSTAGIINKDLAELLKKDGYQNVSQAVGADIIKEKANEKARV